MTSEQLEASRAERLRLNGNRALTLEDARTWMEETGLCLFLPKRQYSTSIAPSFLEAVIGKRDMTPTPEQITLAEELLVRLELDGVAVRLNLLGLPGRSLNPPSRPLSASFNACSRVTTIFSKTWFALISFFISASIFSKSSGEMRCDKSTS